MFTPGLDSSAVQHVGEPRAGERGSAHRSEEHTSELQSPCNLVCRLLLEKKKKAQLKRQEAQCLDAQTAASQFGDKARSLESQMPLLRRSYVTRQCRPRLT